jgi:hypothetical protein
MVNHALRHLFFVLLSALLTSCAGGSSQELLVEVLDCKNSRISASKNIVYVVVGNSCEGNFVNVKIYLAADEVFRKLEIGTIASVGVRETVVRLETFRENSWRKIENKQSWSPRDGAGVVYFNGKIHLIGGWNHSATTNEVWVTDNLYDWIRLPDAPWTARHGAGWVVHDGRIYVVGGDLIPDVWHTQDGINWTQNVSNAPFGEVYTPIAHSFKGYIYLYGGQYWGPVRWCGSRPDCFPVGINDVWRSRDGANWEKVGSAPWSGRGLIHGSLVFKDEIFILGGGLKNATERYSETYIEFSDIWSSKDGENWTKRSDAFSFAPRTHFSVLATSEGCYVSDGSVGTQTNLSNRLYFATNCIDYSEISTPQEMPPRHASSLFEFNGSIVILGGPPRGDSGTAIWQYFPRIRI